MKALVAIALAAVIAAITASQAPELKRYLKIRAM
jgi:hypothetical protein